MLPDEIDRMLSGEDEIAVSSGFTASVMAAVRREAATPPPIPFPWKRALPGLSGAAVVLASWALVLVARSQPGSEETALLPVAPLASLAARLAPEMVWPCAGFALAVLGVSLSMWLATSPRGPVQL